jgi:hypothetical protein
MILTYHVQPLVFFLVSTIIEYDVLCHCFESIDFDRSKLDPIILVWTQIT